MITIQDMTANASALFAPLMDRKQFARAVGVSEQTVEGWIARRELPMVKIGRRNLVNVAAIHQRCVTNLAAWGAL